MKPAMRRLKARIDWEEHGAAPLLGVNGVCFVGHGKSRTKAIKSAIRTVTAFVEQRVNEHIHDELAADRTSAA
jgi:glycerol-3-phosphate acyltransferase PlsX